MQSLPNREVDAVAYMIISVMNAHILNANHIYKSCFSMNPGLHLQLDLLVIDDMLTLQIIVEPKDTRSN